MRRLLLIATLGASFWLPHFAVATSADSALSKKLISRAVTLMDHTGGYVFDVQPAAQEHGSAVALVDALLWQRKAVGPLIIMSTDPDLGARVALDAFSSCRPGTLHGLRVVCLLGRQYDSRLRLAAKAAGADLEIERLPR
jgi:hypothetical protein